VEGFDRGKTGAAKEDVERAGKKIAGGRVGRRKKRFCKSQLGCRRGMKWIQKFEGKRRVGGNRLGRYQRNRRGKKKASAAEVIGEPRQKSKGEGVVEKKRRIRGGRGV